MLLDSGEPVHTVLRGILCHLHDERPEQVVLAVDEREGQALTVEELAVSEDVTEPERDFSFVSLEDLIGGGLLHPLVDGQLGIPRLDGADQLLHVFDPSLVPTAGWPPRLLFQFLPVHGKFRCFSLGGQI